MKDGRDDSGRFSGLLSSSSSPRIGFSRSSSRLSFQDELDDVEFSCPFDVDDVYSSDSHTRYFDLPPFFLPQWHWRHNLCLLNYITYVNFEVILPFESIGSAFMIDSIVFQ